MAEKGLMLWEKVIFVPANIEQRQTNQQNNNSLRLFKPQMCSQSGLGTKNTWSGFRTHHVWHLGMTLTQTSCRPCGPSAHFITTTQTHWLSAVVLLSSRLTSSLFTYSITFKPCDLDGLHLYRHKQTCDVLCCPEVPAHSLYPKMRKGNILAVTFMRTDVTLRVHPLTVCMEERRL